MRALQPGDFVTNTFTDCEGWVSVHTPAGIWVEWLGVCGAPRFYRYTNGRDLRRDPIPE